jgi:branched-chain amino acid transport system substrate-binding protein
VFSSFDRYAAAEGESCDGQSLQEIANNVKEIWTWQWPRMEAKSLGGAKIKLIIQTIKVIPQLGADLAKKLIQDDKVVGLMGAYHSAVTKTVAAVAERYGVPIINESSTSPALTKEGLKWFWRTTHDTTFTNDLFVFLEG